jgi:hypothetical protein
MAGLTIDFFWGSVNILRKQISDQNKRETVFCCHIVVSTVKLS